jgi:cytochrome c553
MTCHSRAAQFVLGVNTPQMNRDHDYGGVKANQLRTLAHIGAFSLKPDKAGLAQLPKPPEKMAALPNPYDGNVPLNDRARSYLHANCAHCHVEAGGGNSAITLRWNTPADKMQLIGSSPLHEKFGIPDAQLVFPGSPERSILMQRVLRIGQGGMPPVAKSLVDEAAVKMLSEWIRELKPPLAN